MFLSDKTILLIISGGIAAYKALELIRLIRKRGGAVRCILTQGGQKFVTPLSVATLSESKVFTDLWSLTDESEMGHIRLVREADLVVIAPASANIIAKMAHGLADDLASTALLACEKPIMIAPAMNLAMWAHPATQANIDTLKRRGVFVIDPAVGDTACGETGKGRMVEPEEILARIESFFQNDKSLQGVSALVTSGATHEPIDPVRFIGNRSSGKQGHAVAAALAAAGAQVTLVSGVTNLPDPAGVQTIHVETAQEMLAACQSALPVDIAVCAAAVVDWRVANAGAQKLKKSGGVAPVLEFTENADILATLSQAAKNRPRLVVGFAAETENLLSAAQEKLKRKGCDWILANDVSGGGVFGRDENHVYLVDHTDSPDDWGSLPKAAVAKKLVARIVEWFEFCHAGR